MNDRRGPGRTPTLVPGAHGGDGERLAVLLGIAPEDVLDLSASLNPVAPDPTLVVVRHLGVVGRYPDGERALGAAAEALGVDRSRLVLTNGGAEAIALVAQLHPSGRVEDPEFSLYRRHLQRLDPHGPRWMSDPNNPTGRLAPASELAFVRDEAFYPLATGTWTRGDPSTIVVGSFTKVFACPGLRIGYVVAPDEATARRLDDLRPQWSLNGLAVAALPEMLAGADITGWAAAIAELRRQLADLLCSHGLDHHPGSANYLWLPEAPGLRDRLLRHAIVVRSGASFGWADGVRIAVPDEAGLDRVSVALRGYEHDQPGSSLPQPERADG